MSTFKRIWAVVTALIICISVFSLSFAGAEGESPLEIVAEKGVILNMESGVVLYDKGSNDVVFCGFLPRLMTCILLVESGYPLDTMITVHEKTKSLTRMRCTRKDTTQRNKSLRDL